MARVVPADRAGDVGRSDRTGGGGRSPRVREIDQEQLQNPEFRELWTQEALARVVSLAVLTYRTDRGLSQTALAEELGLKQPAVSRLEIGEVNPSIETLRRLSSVLGMEFLISIAPSGRPKLLGKEAARAGFTERIDSNGSYVFIAAD